MKYLLITPALALIGCASSNKTIDELIDPFDGPEKTIHIPANVADSNGKWDGSKGKFPPGRVINYKGHGLGYDSHINHHRHMQSVHGHGGLGYHND